MIGSWLRQRRRKKILSAPFPDPWLAFLTSNVRHFGYLNAAEQAELRNDVQVFVAEKNWEGCGGLQLTDEMKVTIAGHACLMALALPGEPLSRVLSILIYPAVYAVPEERWYDGWSITGQSSRLGESWYRGPVILSWADVRHDTGHAGEGRNLVWHEFAHQLDALDRSLNGTPPLDNFKQRRRWHEVMTDEFEQLITDARQGRATLLDTYGASSEAEFFAVATECFFDCPVELHAEHSRLDELLREYYRQDPAARLTAADH